ncbi:hypothetical protein ACXN5S_18275 [Pseudoroseicyclus sp. H15]
MLFSLVGLIIGAVIGAWRAYAKSGNGKDMAQWGAVCGVIGAIIGVIVTIVVLRTAG